MLTSATILRRGSGALTENVRRQIHSKVEVERSVCVEHTTSSFFLTPLDGNRDAAVESIEPEDGEVGEADVGGDDVHGFTQRRSVGWEDAPVKSEHAQFGEALS